MKHKILLSVLAFAAVLCGCENDDDVKDRVDDLEGRVTRLESLCTEMNTNIQALQAFVNGVKDNLYVSSVTETSNGFTITFDNGKTYTLQNGEKGNKGDKGDKGDQGEVGEAPSITIGEADGGYWWKVNGEYVLIDGNRVSAAGTTPQLKIEDGKWKISYDKGETWQEVAAAYDYSHEITVTQDDDNVYLTLADSTVITLPKVPGFKFRISELDDIVIPSGTSKDLNYTIQKGDSTVHFVVISDHYSAKVIPEDVTKGVVRITAPDPAVEGYALITAVQNSTGESKSQYISFAVGGITIISDAAEVEAIGGVVNVDLKTNIDYTINIPEEDRSWISVATGTKAFVTETKSFIVLQNTTGAPRSSTISFVPEDGETVYYTISQKYDVTNPEFSVSPVSISAAMTDESASFNVSGNTPWYIDLTGDCTASTLSGVGAATVTLTFGANNNVGYKNFTATVHSTATTVSPNVYTVAVEQEGLPDPNDYYSVFKRGEDITINGKAYNIKDYPNPRLVKPAELTDGEELVKSVSANGILFIDDDANSRITIAGRDSILLPDVVVIGRYRNSQPTIDAGSLNLCPVGGVVVFKNIGYTSANPYGFMFNNDREEVTGNSSIILEDCSIITATNTPVIRDQNTKYSYERIVVNNSVVVCPQPILLDYSVTKTDNATALSEFKVTNSTLNLPNGALYNYYRMLYLDRNNIDLPNVVVTLDHNTIYGMNYGFLPLKGVKSININHNVIAAPLPRNIYILSLTENVRETSSFNNNVFASTTTFQYYPCNGATAGRGVTNTPNTVLKETNVFTKTDFANGYLPVDTSVVTDGSGCDYSTKLWKNWN